MSKSIKVERGDILLIEFSPTRGSEIQKTRPAVVVTNNIANTYSRVIMVIPITSQKLDKIYPYEVLLQEVKGLSKLSKANISQMRAIDRARIKETLGKVTSKNLLEIEIALKLHLNLI
jgi:mRNA interferase MazF